MAAKRIKQLFDLAFLCVTLLHTAAAESDQPQIIDKHRDEITHIPGLEGRLRSRHYGGYISVDEENGRNMYYYFVTSQGDPVKDPLVLWLNGGPGCSSLDGKIKIEMNRYAHTRAQIRI